jgi:hypothetical protein
MTSAEWAAQSEPERTERCSTEFLASLRGALALSSREHHDHTGATCFQDYGQSGERRDDCCCICAAANHVMAAIKELE